MENASNASNTDFAGQIYIRDLLDLKLLKDLFDKFSEITGLTIGFLELPGLELLIDSGWKDICTKFHRDCPLSADHCYQSNRRLMQQFTAPGQLIIEKCENGLYDCATPIYINGQLIAGLATGQLLLEEPDVEFFRNQAHKYEYDVEAYLKAVADVKVISEKDLLLATTFLGQIATFISESGYNSLVVKQETLLLEHEVEERKHTEEDLRKSELKIRTVLALAPEAFFHGDQIGHFIDVNDAAVELTGYPRKELLNMNMKDLFPRAVLDSEPLRYDVLNAGTTLTKRRTLIRQNGESIIIEMSSRLMPDGTYQCFAKDITENINAQEALNKSESRLRMFFECSQEGLIFHDKGIVVDVNIAMLQMSGYSNEKELVGKNIIEYISPAFRDIVMSHVLDEKIEKYEAEILRRDGTILPVEIIPRHAEFSDGRKLRITSLTDITERKKAEQMRDINARRTLALLKLSEMINTPLNEITNFVLEEVIQLTGSKLGYLAFLNEKEDILTMHSWSKSAMEECRINDAPREYPLEKTGLWGESVRQRKPIITNDYAADSSLKKGYPEGHVVVKRHLSVPIFDNDHIVVVIGVGNKEDEYYDECIKQLTILGSALWTHIDRQRVMKELIESREQFRLITENSNDMLVAFDAESGIITYLSPGSGRIQKFDSGDVIQHTFLDFIHPDDLPAIFDAQKIIMSGHELPLVKHRVMMKDGSFVWYESSAKLVKNTITGKYDIIGVCRDISEKVKTEQLQKEKDLAEAASKAKSEFLANVSHEIRNPLNSIVGLANTLSRKQLSNEMQEIIDAIKTSSGNLLNIINDVLDLSKIEANKIELAMLEFDVRSIFSDVNSLFKVTADSKDIHLVFSIAQDVPSNLTGDGNRFKQIVVNLVGNAIKFTDKGSVSINVSAEPTADERVQIVTKITDTGIGIKKEDFGKLFMSFAQLDSSTTKKFAGTGLGLAIVKSLAEMMGGNVSVDSEFGKGSCFTVKIPFMAASGKPVETIVADDAKFSAHIRVLLVEDDALNQMYLKGFLKDLGMQVDSAFNGIQALEKYEANQYDVILMDGQMPQMDGFEATRIIREKEKASGRHTPVVAITGYAIKGDEERFLNAGMDSYITKPFDENKLIEVIRRLTAK